MEPIVKVKGLSYTYPDGTKALNNVGLEIFPSNTIAFLGGNGAGKSTLFKCLNGILKPTCDLYQFQGEEVDYSKKSIAKLRESVGIVFQDPDIQLFSANVYQDISFGPMNMYLTNDEVRARVERAMKATGVEELKDRPTHFLSHGQKKRVAIAGVLAMEPKLIILDEPTAGLDPKGVSELLNILKTLKEELNMVILIATHDIDIVPLYADYCYVMDEGKLVFSGSPEEIFKEPERIRSLSLRLPRIAHLMEILKKEDGLDIEGMPSTISEARKEILKNEKRD
ncbi:MAG: ATP-binding cassette domain-containing protein [Tissierellia bacterium]|nr:ATP-binding cassette domain-containing protein [Tissierellia bacterium]